MTRTLIIGATSEVAMEVARRLSRQGHELLLLARDQDRLNELAAELEPHVISTRASDFLDIPVTQGHIEALFSLGEVDQVVIAQGYLGNQLESERNLDEALRQISVNFTSVVAQLLVVSDHLERRGGGHLLVLSSVAGDRGRPRNYTYGAAKGALGIYLQGLRSRLVGRVAVTTVKLGPVITRMSAGHQRNVTFITKERAAREICRALSGRGGEVYVPGFYRWIMLLVRNLPEVVFQRLAFLAGR